MILRFSAIVVLALTLGPLAGVAAAADSAESMYTKALARERVMRDAARHPTVKQLRAAVRAYENIVRRFPRSGYSDNALWQGANLSLLAYELFGQASDRRASLRLLEQLRKGYPSSSLVARVDEVVRRSESLRATVVAEARAKEAAAKAPVVRAVNEKPVAEPPASSPAGLVAIRNITRTPLPDGMRVSIVMDGESNYHAERITGPDRVFFDLKGTTAAPPLQDATLTFADDVVREIRLGRHPQNTTRVVMDMAGVESYSVFTLYEPFRLVVDFKAAAPASKPLAPPVAPAPPGIAPPPPAVSHSPLVPGPAAAAGPAASKSADPVPGPELEPLPSRRAVPPALNPAALPSVNADGKFSMARQLGLGISRIVIDAGHGGTDPGSMANGVREAELALDVAQRLRKLLEKQTQIEVVMTRSTDVFIPLDERTVIANKEGADLFLSIHANTARNLQARGVETYFLNFAPNPEAEAVAARENATSGGTMHNLPGIVKAITLNNKIDESRDFAAAVQRSMVQRLATRNKQLKDRGVKQAPFVVLIGAEMPSVLAEISFLTNKQEARLLKTAAYRQQIAEALFDGVLRYQQSVKKMKSIGTVGTTREAPAVGRQ
jgi:N-acetylmuramoyl-L-alanine amidase